MEIRQSSEKFWRPCTKKFTIDSYAQTKSALELSTHYGSLGGSAYHVSMGDIDKQIEPGRLRTLPGGLSMNTKQAQEAKCAYDKYKESQEADYLWVPRRQNI